MSKEQAVYDVLVRSGFKVRMGNGNLSIPCPLAPYSALHKNDRDRRPSMGIKVTETAVLVNCFTCGFKCGQISYLYKKLAYHNHAWKPAVDHCVELEKNFLAMGMSSLASQGFFKKEEKQAQVTEEQWQSYANKFSKYLLTRNISFETGKRWGVGLDEQSNRVVIPIRDFNNKLFGAVGRAISDKVLPKYLNYWQFKKSNHLLGSHLINTTKKIIVVEGSLDAMRADEAICQAGLSDEYAVVSILGSRISDKQCELIQACALEVIIALDYDQAGYDGTKLAYKKLSKMLITKVACIGDVGQKDFGECSNEQVLAVIENAKKFF